MYPRGTGKRNGILKLMNEIVNYDKSSIKENGKRTFKIYMGINITTNG